MVLRCGTVALYDRLAHRRGYAERKLQENMDAEIMEVLLQEARDSYDEAIVVELWSDDLKQLDDNVERVVKWFEAWVKEHDGEGNERKDEHE